MDSYQELLTRPEWKEFKTSILRIWGGGCMRCEREDRPLHVHHRRYIAGKMPWEYEWNDLEVLCDICHRKAHEPDRRVGLRQVKTIRQVMFEFIEGLQKKLRGK